MIPQLLVEGTRNGSFSQSHPQFRPAQPSHLRYALYRESPFSRPSSKSPEGMCSCVWGGTNVLYVNKPFKVCRQHGKERCGAGVLGIKDSRGSQG